MIQMDTQHKLIVCIGCEGKWAIHPSQIDLANKVMSPSDKEVNQAKEFWKPWNRQKRKRCCFFGWKINRHCFN